MITTIIWDWNGTLLNDVDLNLEIVNIILKKRNLKTLSKEKYRELFKIPIKGFYQDVGLDHEDESFNIIAKEYFKLYLLKYETCNLNKNIEPILQKIIKKGIDQYILSATDHKTLLNQVNKKNINDFFKGIIGSDNIHGKSKLQKAIELMEIENIKSKEALLIGDTMHDYEVARQIGVKCLLYKNGHQKLEENSNYNIIGSMEEIFQFL